MPLFQNYICNMVSFFIKLEFKTKCVGNPKRCAAVSHLISFLITKFQILILILLQLTNSNFNIILQFLIKYKIFFVGMLKFTSFFFFFLSFYDKTLYSFFFMCLVSLSLYIICCLVAIWLLLVNLVGF